MNNDNFEKIALFKNSGFALVDSDLGILMSQHRWLLAKGRSTNYAKAWIDGGYVYMHHAVLGGVPRNGFVVDHINGDGLDNRRANLQVITNGDNIAKSDRTGVGISYLKRLKSRPWKVEVKVEGVRHHIGYFATEEEALEARNAFLIARGKEVRTLDN